MRNKPLSMRVVRAMARSITLTLPALLLGLVLHPVRSSATTVVAPAFDSLVSQSDYVVRGVVKSVTSDWQRIESQRHIFTRVTVEVTETIAGTPPTTLVLEILGGRVGNEELVVEGAPVFHVGDEDILFVHGNGSQFFPLVAIMHGRYPVRHEAGSAIVTRSNGVPLYDEHEVALPMNRAVTHPAGAQPLTPSEFSARIRRSYQNSHPQQKQQ